MTDDVNSSDSGTYGGIVEDVEEVLNPTPAPEPSDPNEDQRRMTQELLDEWNKHEQEQIYKHDVDDDDPPERRGPYPAGGPS